MAFYGQFLLFMGAGSLLTGLGGLLYPPTRTTTIPKGARRMRVITSRKFHSVEEWKEDMHRTSQVFVWASFVMVPAGALLLVLSLWL